MDHKSEPEGKGKKSVVRQIVTAVLVLAVLAALLVAARALVGSVDIVELLKKIHGG